MTVFDVIRSDGPVVLGQPHGGTFVPDNLVSRLNSRGRELADTDWHITSLYDGLIPSATVVKSNVHRYVIDANRDPAGKSLYPGRNTTALCPTTDFDGLAIWKPGQEPSGEEVEERRLAFHAPYHAALASELERVRTTHGCAVLFDCHSIRSEISFLFNGVLPAFNIGTNGGQTCAPEFEDATHHLCKAAAADFDTILNGRFKGGWTTRRYGRPQDGFHSIQMEISQRSYMIEEAPWTYRPDRAGALRAVLARILNEVDQLARKGGF